MQGEQARCEWDVRVFAVVLVVSLSPVLWFTYLPSMGWAGAHDIDRQHDRPSLKGCEKIPSYQFSGISSQHKQRKMLVFCAR
jgi:hypothetical protein